LEVGHVAAVVCVVLVAPEWDAAAACDGFGVDFGVGKTEEGESSLVVADSAVAAGGPEAAVVAVLAETRSRKGPASEH